ncbi:hypothetical protein THRCLA_21811 [Thraustotheca clavata]|uniref:Uncharacterized protein n=1 Tax=Thraustotheca clavata TaxID=74557 RepID=A0A1V9ZNT1_9STRA|nr:hypothetical protein THRCLA_21811 [Thraustotheca clavata]
MPQATGLILSIIAALAFACAVFVFEVSFFSPTPAPDAYYNTTEIVVVIEAVPVYKTYRLESAVDDKTQVHLVYSSSCKQGNRFFYSSSHQLSLSCVDHYGPVTEIVLGCTPEDIENLLRRDEDITDTVGPGIALAQNMKAVVGGRWFNMWNNTTKTIICICGGLPCMNVSNDDAFDCYEPTRTPYILTRPDWLRIYDWMVEMYAYGAEAANQDMKHTLLKHLGPQTCNNHGTEQWDFIDENFPNLCEDPVSIALPEDPPIAIHNAMFYGLGGNIDKGYCMMIQLPPATEWTQIKRMNITDEEKLIKRHHVWMECTMIKYSNIVLKEIKTRMCPNGFNSRRGLILLGSDIKYTAHEIKSNCP